MAWEKDGSKTLQSAGNNVTVSSLTDNKFSLVLSTTIADSSGGTQQSLQFNGDTGSNYGRRYNANGGSDSSSTSTRISTGASTAANSLGFTVGYIINITGEESLAISNGADTSTAGAGTAPTRYEAVGKWANTTAINRIDIFNPTSGDFQIGSNSSVLGSDGVESIKVQDGAVYYETDTNKEYILSNGSWSEL